MGRIISSYIDYYIDKYEYSKKHSKLVVDKPANDISSLSDRNRLFDISNALQNGHFNADAEIVAEKVAALIKKSVPGYLLGEWRLANNLANLPILDAVVECLIEKGVLTPPEDSIGAEGCWMSVEK